jgi:hypothetical protein
LTSSWSSSWSILSEPPTPTISTIDTIEDFLAVPSLTGIGDWVSDFDVLDLSLDELRDWDAKPSQHGCYIKKVLRRFEVGFFGLRGEGEGEVGLGTIFEEEG